MSMKERQATESGKVPFTKMQGAGNDYVYVNTLLYSVPDPEATAIKWSDRHFGIGSDGLVLIGAPSDEAVADFSMRIFNADGSEAMMCGNASRCIGKYVYERGLFHSDTVRLETLSGVKILKLHIAGGKVESVTVDMGEPRFDVPEQYTAPETAPNGTMPVGTEGVFVSMGNPHYVIFVDDISKVDVAREGRVLEFDKAFPERCNIEFAQPEARPSSAATLRTRVWERGSGITMACGTGACATAVAAAKTGRAARQSDIVMDGGTLHIEWGDDNHVRMTGPAAFVFDGEKEL
ncbi:diaminopimelate epimerase [Hallella multisaccharivorax]|uniref:diaminopimelate epimerase n=1 Tax=Hallella multisaccharivorax TaxID=310514 RepID=UPI00361AC590